jgi:uncharacterized protein YbgA (DUF1722 family)
MKRTSTRLLGVLGTGSNINVMYKIMGYFSSQLSKEERDFFMKSIEKYKNGKTSSECKHKYS